MGSEGTKTTTIARALNDWFYDHTLPDDKKNLLAKASHRLVELEAELREARERERALKEEKRIVSVVVRRLVRVKICARKYLAAVDAMKSVHETQKARGTTSSERIVTGTNAMRIKNTMLHALRASVAMASDVEINKAMAESALALEARDGK